MSDYKPSSLDLKTSLMAYFRFVRGWLCATECLNCDVLTCSLSTGDLHEVEVKISKSDLWKGEARKTGHNWNVMKHSPENVPKFTANKFSVCVPRELIEEAKKWVEATNPKYGVIEYKHTDWIPAGHNITVIRKAQRLHDNGRKIIFEALLMRVCSENIGHMQDTIRRIREENLKRKEQNNG